MQRLKVGQQGWMMAYDRVFSVVIHGIVYNATRGDRLNVMIQDSNGDAFELDISPITFLSTKAEAVAAVKQKIKTWQQILKDLN